MTARTHDMAALTALAGLLLVYDPGSMTLTTVLIALFANQLGGIAPDIDQPTAPLWRNLPSGHFAGRVFGRLLGGHRFLSHSLLGFGLFAWLCLLLLHFLHPVMLHVDSTLVWFSFMIGYASHLIMDSFTKEGVPWLLPVPYKFGFPPLRRLRVTTGHWVENFVVLPGLIMITFWLVMHHYDVYTALLRSVQS